MKTRLSVPVLLGIALVSGGVAAGGDAKDAKAERAKFQGTWVLESMQKEGRTTRASELPEQITITFSGSKVMSLGDKEDVATFMVVPSASPREIDLIQDGKTSQGIYQFKGGKLYICGATKPGQARPTKFEAPKGSNNMLMVLKRAKK
jgi:uncharacterized protein (TIGR03067 family)